MIVLLVPRQSLSWIPINLALTHVWRRRNLCTYQVSYYFERLKNYSNADRDLKHSLKINPDDAYVLNYLAYSWLERNHRINEAIDMLEIAYKKEKDDPYIIDSIGWAYYLIKDFVKAEKLLKRAVE